MSDLPLDVLLLEDNCDDAELIRTELANEGILCSFHRVETETEFDGALRTRHWDLILSDYTLPAFDGLKALSRAQAVAPQVPFIFVSGTMGEDPAIESLRRGATDYVLKQKLSRLPHSVTRAIREGEERLARFESEKARAAAWEMETLLLESSPDATLIAGPDHIIRRINEQTEVMFEYSRQELIGQSFEILMTEQSSRSTHYRRDVPRSASRQSYDRTGITKRGREFPMAIAISSTKTEEGTLLILTIRDITERKRIEYELTKRGEAILQANERLFATMMELERARIKAEYATELKDQFLTNMSYEIRTPLNGVIGLVDLLIETPAEQQEQSLELLRECAHKLLGVVTDILDFEKLEAGILPLLLQPVSLQDNIIRAITPLVQQAKEKGLELTWNLSSAVPDTVVADPQHLVRVLRNIVGNAVTFTHSGRVSLEVTLDTTSNVVFSVTDTGPGIAWDQYERIFAPFVQADNSLNRAHTGTGLGLSISRHLVALWGGTMWLKSEPGEGCIFYFTIPHHLPRPQHNSPIESNLIAAIA